MKGRSILCEKCEENLAKKKNKAGEYVCLSCLEAKGPK